MLTRTQLVQRISEVCNLSRRDSKVVLECMLHAVIEALKKGDNVYIRRFGTFHTRLRSPRPSRNPITGAHVTSPAKKIARFKASKELLRLVAGAIDELASDADEPGSFRFELKRSDDACALRKEAAAAVSLV